MNVIVGLKTQPTTTFISITVQIKFWYNKNSYQKAGSLVLQYTSKLVFGTTVLEVKCKNRISGWLVGDMLDWTWFGYVELTRRTSSAKPVVSLTSHSEKLCFEESSFLLTIIFSLYYTNFTKKTYDDYF